MKRKVLFLALALSLVMALVPGTALAAKPEAFSASGTITGITPGDVFPAGNSGRFVVAEREITGVLSGDISGDFTLTYKANVALATQAGRLYGTLAVDGHTAKVNGEIQPLEWLGAPFASPALLTIDGRWAFTGARGQGNFSAWAIVILTPEGHVAYIVDSGFAMTGSW